MRIILVSVNRESVPSPVAPLGISYVAGAARSAGHEVEILDLCFSRDIQEDIDRAVRRFAPELIGISIRNVDNLTFPSSVSYLHEIQAAVTALRRVSRAPIVAGGPGFSIFPEQFLSLLDLEFGIVG
ncbi:MAG TPA: cobalamin-dependent protein, partial [Candidatus Acidoferrum sp.]|nr:cobalamin-dependent protein [Candidatus Acidoferrum sp.]